MCSSKTAVCLLQCMGFAIYEVDLNYYTPINSRYIHNVVWHILVISSLFGFFSFDALYGTVVINYVSQCELIIYFLRSINVKVTTKSQPLDEAIKVKLPVLRNLHVND